MTMNGMKPRGYIEKSEGRLQWEREQSFKQMENDMSDETGWIIENEDPPVYHTISGDHDEHWTSDVNKALRFARKEDAEAYIDHVGWTVPPIRAAEHMWPIPRAVRL